MDVDKFAEVIHETYKEVETVLQEDLLFGLDDEKLGNITFDRAILDNTGNSKPGYGILATERDQGWILMEHIMQTEQLFTNFFHDLDADGKPKLRRERGLEFLEKIAHFKRLLFILMHFLSGMPKRGTEVVKFKIANLANRMRNFYLMYNHLAIVGLYNKTSANTGKDNVTLHFLPHSISNLIQRFYYFVGDLERWMVQKLFPSEVSANWPVYFFSSYGKRWTSKTLSDILQKQFERLMGIPLNLQQLRHILPAISDHYSITSPTLSGFSLLHHQMGHSSDIGGRFYSRTTDGHHQLTNQFCHDSLDFCTRIHKLWGFHDIPSIEDSRAYRESIADKFTGAEEKAFRDQIQSMNVKLDKQKEANDRILDELQTLKSLLSNQLANPSHTFHDTEVYFLLFKFSSGM